VPRRPMRGGFSASAFFLGGMAGERERERERERETVSTNS